MHRQEGFSLVELLIVVAIIGIIAAIAIPSLLSARRASNEAAAIGNLRTIGSAEATYFSQRGRYGNFAELTAQSMLDSAMTNNATRDSYGLREGATPPGAAFEFLANPSSTGAGTRGFNILDDFVIRQSVAPPGTLATAPTGTSGSPIGVG